MISLESLRCACGSAEIICVDPGDDPEISEASDIVVSRGRPARGMCLACWPSAPGYQQTLLADGYAPDRVAARRLPRAAQPAAPARQLNLLWVGEVPA